jgi:hypothetical protein
MNDFPPLASCCGQADEAPDSSLRTLVNARNAVRCQRRLRLPRRLGPGFEMIQKLAALGIVSETRSPTGAQLLWCKISFSSHKRASKPLASR